MSQLMSFVKLFKKTSFMMTSERAEKDGLCLQMNNKEELNLKIAMNSVNICIFTTGITMSNLVSLSSDSYLRRMI